MTKKIRVKSIDNLFLSRHPTIFITSYQLFSNMTEEFCNNRVWDYVVLDEGHVIKNPQTKISKAVHKINVKHRLILTGLIQNNNQISEVYKFALFSKLGTPVQNQLTEFWALVDWISNGTILGSKVAFSRRFAEPINKGQDPKCDDHARNSSSIAIQELLRLIRPILLQRKKCEKGDILKLPGI